MSMQEYRVKITEKLKGKKIVNVISYSLLEDGYNREDRYNREDYLSLSDIEDVFICFDDGSKMRISISDHGSIELLTNNECEKLKEKNKVNI